MKINHLALNNSTLAGERHGKHASNLLRQTPWGEENMAEGRSTTHARDREKYLLSIKPLTLRGILGQQHTKWETTL